MEKQHQIESRVNLRAVNEGDVSFLWKVANDPSLMDILCDEPSDTSYWQDAVDIWQADPDEEDFVIVRKSDGTQMGWLGINGLVSGEDVAWLKMIALLPEYWEQGYGSDALRQVKTHLVAKGFARIRLWTDQCNERSKGCYRRSGFVVIEHKKTSVGTRMVTRDRALMECVFSDDVTGRLSRERSRWRKAAQPAHSADADVRPTGGTVRKV